MTNEDTSAKQNVDGSRKYYCGVGKRVAPQVRRRDAGRRVQFRAGNYVAQPGFRNCAPMVSACYDVTLVPVRVLSLSATT